MLDVHEIRPERRPLRRLPIARILAAGLLGLLAATASSATAQTADAVLVLPVGGITTAPTFDLDRSVEPVRVVELGETRILPDELGRSRVSDLKVMPDGSFLLSDVDGRGAVVTDATGESIRWSLGSAGRFTSVSAASVAAYFSPGQPSQVLISDTASSSVSVRGIDGNVSWYRDLRLTGAPAMVNQAAVTPDRLAAIAVSWPSLGVHALEVLDLDDPVADGLRIANTQHSGAPRDLVIRPELDEVRDLMVLEDGSYLVTTPYDVLLLSARGELVTRFGVADSDAVNGQLASARRLDSGLVVFATFQPGVWVQPHSNHRVHWLDLEGGTLVGTSAALTRAPLRVEPLSGHGGTGTFGFDAGFSEIGGGDPTQIKLLTLDIPSVLQSSAQVDLRAVLRNEGPNTVSLANIVIRASAAGCGAALQRDYDVLVADGISLPASSAYQIQGTASIIAPNRLGAWCAYVEGQDTAGTWHVFEPPAPFELVAEPQGSASVIEVEPLPFGARDQDMGADGGPDGSDGGEGPMVVNDGCCATTRPTRSSAACGWLLLAAALSARRRRK